MFNRCMQLHTGQPVSARLISSGLTGSSSLCATTQMPPSSSRTTKGRPLRSGNCISLITMSRGSCDWILQPMLPRGNRRGSVSVPYQLKAPGCRIPGLWVRHTGPRVSARFLYPLDLRGWIPVMESGSGYPPQTAEGCRAFYRKSGFYPRMTVLEQRRTMTDVCVNPF